MDVGFLGVAGAITSARSGNTSLVVSVSGQSPLLIDCSGNPPQALAAVGVDWLQLEHIVITHRHADHLAGLPSLLHQLRIATKSAPRPPLSVWGPDEALAIARRLLEAVELYGRDDMFEIVLRPLPTDRSTELDVAGWSVTAFPVSHGHTPTLGYRVAPADRPAAVLVCSADTEPCEAVWRHSRDAELLVHECSSFDDANRLSGHSTLAQLEPLLAECGAKRVRLVHLPPVSSAEHQHAEQRIAKRFGGRVQLATAGLVESL